MTAWSCDAESDKLIFQSLWYLLERERGGGGIKVGNEISKASKKGENEQLRQERENESACVADLSINEKTMSK